MSAVVAIVNPASAAGKTAKHWDRVRKALPDDIDVRHTEFPGHAIELTRSAVQRGAKTVIAAGGDGTINEVVNGLFELGSVNASATLGIIPLGTGSDLRRSLNLPEDGKEAAFIIQNAVPRLMDVMRVRYTEPDGRTATRFAI